MKKYEHLVLLVLVSSILLKEKLEKSILKSHKSHDPISIHYFSVTSVFKFYLMLL